MNRTRFADLGVVVAVLAVAAPVQAAPIAVTPWDGVNASALANVILGGGVTLNSASYSGAPVAAGTFASGLSAGMGIDQGLLLTSGSASNVTGNNTSDGMTGDNSLPGLGYLDALVPGYSTYDATELTINFTMASPGDLFFNYVFGSDEYNEWVGSPFNDVFGFFLDGTAVANNTALIPNSSTAVAINNVNLGLNSQWYHNNDLGDFSPNPPPFAFEYDGFTKVFTAKALNLSAGAHTMTLAIADSGDWVLDSGVFIQGGSFNNSPTPVDDPDEEVGVPDGGTTVLLLGIAALGLAVLRRRH